ncbi:MAG: pirin family protein [Corynebacterium sp.]|uniref:pirin family protein n=1 Tax=Corynebacterium sp. TaxID=1720 RepID=UPI0026DEDA0B|nr:pirin family protein [Corynebacterium sp.]MDO5668384.1 pirin family protein [Corynebacterium sp.]
MTTTVVRSEERDRWRDAAIDSRQSFPATGNFDLEANAFGLLLVHNDDTVAPGEGFDMHFHKDVEIVTWVIEGAVHHRDSGSEHITEVRAGMAQHISAGSGVRHSEVNAGGYTSGRTVRVVQSWLPADELGTPPSHASHDFSGRQGLTQIAGPGSPLPLGTSGASLYIALIDATPLTVPGSAYVHLYVLSGRIDVAGHTLAEGDVLRGRDVEKLEVTGDGEILVWMMDRAINA